MLQITGELQAAEEILLLILDTNRELEITAGQVPSE